MRNESVDNAKTTRRAFLRLTGGAALGMIAMPAFAQDGPGGGDGGRPGGGGPGGPGGGGGGGNGTPPELGQELRQHHPARGPLPADVAANKDFSAILGRPTDKSIVLNVLSATPVDAFVEYGASEGQYDGKTDRVTLAAGTPVEVKIDGLSPNKQYHYRVRRRTIGAADFAPGPANRFHTQRAPGSSFSFVLQGDSHPERPTFHDPVLYGQTIAAAASEHPDFYVTIGDDFSVTDRLDPVNADTVRDLYLYQRYFLGVVAASSPVFLNNGNWEQASKVNLDGTPNNISVLAQNARNTNFPQPAPDAFYSGDSQPIDYIGLLRDYYSWTWGDALFITLDPYWHSPLTVDTPFRGKERTHDIWNSTLGEDQYRWLKRTLETSNAKYKIVITHHVLGTARGGVEVAGLGEWGGHDRDGTDSFAVHRPGWEAPIHQLLVKNGVNIVFQGHDHIFAKGELDGVIYQTLPVPGDPNGMLYFADVYKTENKFPNAGYVRVTVNPDEVKVEYVRQYLDGYETDPVIVDYVRQYVPTEGASGRKSGEVAHAYTFKQRTANV